MWVMYMCAWVCTCVYYVCMLVVYMDVGYVHLCAWVCTCVCAGVSLGCEAAVTV